MNTNTIKRLAILETALRLAASLVALRIVLLRRKDLKQVDGGE